MLLSEASRSKPSTTRTNHPRSSNGQENWGRKISTPFRHQFRRPRPFSCPQIFLSSILLPNHSSRMTRRPPNRARASMSAKTPQRGSPFPMRDTRVRGPLAKRPPSPFLHRPRFCTSRFCTSGFGTCYCTPITWAAGLRIIRGSVLPSVGHYQQRISYGESDRAKRARQTRRAEQMGAANQASPRRAVRTQG